VVVEFEGDATLATANAIATNTAWCSRSATAMIKHVNEYFCTILADQKIGPLLGEIEEQRKRQN